MKEDTLKLCDSIFTLNLHISHIYIYINIENIVTTGNIVKTVNILLRMALSHD